jgi:hypothetical protein
MSPQERIQDLCQRYGVSASFGTRMLPIAERALEVRPELRRRMLAFLERSFIAQAEVEAAEAVELARQAPPTPEEARILNLVAGVLDPWEPPRWLDRWAQRIDHSRDGASGANDGAS